MNADSLDSSGLGHGRERLLARGQSDPYDQQYQRPSEQQAQRQFQRPPDPLPPSQQAGYPTAMRSNEVPRSEAMFPRAPSSHASAGTSKPAARSDVCPERLASRDRWNSYEFRIQEIFMKYDKDESGRLENPEFRELLRDFNEGREPSDQEFNFMMRICDKDHDHTINLGELHYAIRAWHSYCHLDDSIMRLFAEFDVDHSGRLDANELRKLLTRMNGGKDVPWQEVKTVMSQSDILGDGAINRSELLGAIAAWYARVDRKDTDIPSLIREAMARTANQTDSLDSILGSATKSRSLSSLGGASTNTGGPDNSQMHAADLSSYADQTAAPPSYASANFAPMQVADVEGQTAAQADSHWRSLGKYTFWFFPTVFSLWMVLTGWMTRDNECPRNLDGLLMWYGSLAVLFTILFWVNYLEAAVGHDGCVDETNLVRGRLGVGVMLAVLNLVGYLWVNDVKVANNKALCGYFLVYWSHFLWSVLPVVLAGTAIYLVASHFQALRKCDEHLQREIET